MNRLRVWAPKLTARRPVRASRAVGEVEPFEPGEETFPVGWVVTGVVLFVVDAAGLVWALVGVSW